MTMEPRLNTSRKSTTFPIDYIKMVKDVIGKNFKKNLKGKELVVDGKIYTEEIVMRIGLITKGELTQRNFEASVLYSIKSKNIMDQIYLAVDALGAMMDEYFKHDGELDMPLTWQEFKIDGKPVYLQTSTINSNLEAQADALLQDEDLGDVDEILAKLGLKDGEEDED